MSKLIYGRTWSQPVHWQHRHNIDFDGIRQKSPRPAKSGFLKKPRSLEEVRQFTKEHQEWIAEAKKRNKEKKAKLDIVLYLVYTLNSILHPEMKEEEHRKRLYNFHTASRVKSL